MVKSRGSSDGVARFFERGAGVIETEATAVNPLVVSVVATLRTGSGSYLKSKGVLEVSIICARFFYRGPTVAAHFLIVDYTFVACCVCTFGQKGQGLLARALIGEWKWN